MNKIIPAVLITLITVFSAILFRTVNDYRQLGYPMVSPTKASEIESVLPAGWADVVFVVDGDTIRVRINGNTETVRFIGIDTPEITDPRKTVECFGRQAHRKTMEMLLNRKLKLESDPTQDDRDIYNRLLRYAYLEDGLFFNDWMVRNGYAHEYTYNIPYKYQEQFKEAENYARENNLGLWDPDTCK